MEESYFPADLDLFKKVQSLAYRCVQTVEGKLEAGMTEKDAVALMREYLKNEGIENFFHLPFAWFGERTRFADFSFPLATGTHQKKKITLPSFKTPLPHFGVEFLASDKKLEEGMPVILDIAPTIKGHAADIGYSFSFGKHEGVHQGRLDLIKFRNLILKMAQEGMLMSEIYAACDALMDGLGYENCHSMYPLGVLGHKVGVLPLQKFPKLNIMGFHPQSLFFLTGQTIKNVFDKQSGKTAFWSHDAHTTLEPGLWAIEPHIGKDDYGVKFEEIMVVTKEEIYWLDDQLPHVEYAKKYSANEAIATSSGPAVSKNS